MIKEEFSKPLDNIALENFGYIQEDKKIHELQLQSLSALKGQEKRERCLLCALSLKNELIFCHRAVNYIKCQSCGHIQTEVTLPSGYPYVQNDNTGFDKIYKALGNDEYISRRKRIYDPKLEWILKHLTNLGFQENNFLNARWLELGSGAGYFLSALKEKKMNNILGIEKNEVLVNLSNKMLGKYTHYYDGELADVFLQYRADIYVAFFVLEHIENPFQFWKNLAKLPRGTVFIFSVPMFGFATLLESAFVNFAARNLDNAVHTQLYTDESISYALENSGYEMASQWIFGQDAHDLVRLMLLKLESLYPKEMFCSIQEKLLKILDPIQTVLDKHYLADARHILAIKS